MSEEYYVIGAMSGTSLDGLDLCCVQFKINKKHVNFRICSAQTIDFDPVLKQKLSSTNLSAMQLTQIDFEFGRFIGHSVKGFLSELNIDNIVCIASHGHTIYHNPAEGYTTQIGHGSAIAHYSGLTCVSDFRALDVVKGGQGAPLVPIGDRDLFGDYDSCINLGGFANISYDEKGVRTAYDICPVNFVLNHLARKLGKEYDDKGDLARSGKVVPELLSRLDNLEFYNLSGPKSLGAEWVMKHVLPIINESSGTVTDHIATFTNHAAGQIAKHLKGKTLFSGGGAYNEYLMDLIKGQTRADIAVAEKEILEFKEALIFAWLGLKRLRKEINTLSSVTGANSDSISGAVYLP